MQILPNDTVSPYYNVKTKDTSNINTKDISQNEISFESILQDKASKVNIQKNNLENSEDIIDYSTTHSSHISDMLQPEAETQIVTQSQMLDIIQSHIQEDNTSTTHQKHMSDMIQPGVQIQIITHSQMFNSPTIDLKNEA